jgi:hypothetical protein
MAVPRVFVSSTWYDLKYIRENLKYFIRGLGYEPVLAEEGSVYFDPRLHAQDACLAEVPNCQVLVLIIGGRLGSSYKSSETSVTNAEYREAVRLRIPIFALIEQAVLNDFRVYESNKTNPSIDVSRIAYPAVDNIGVFSFIEEVRANAVNNALVPFRDFSDIECYLRQQWAGMMHSFLTVRNEGERVSENLSVMKQMSERIEMLSRQILVSVGTEEAKMTAELYDVLIGNLATREMQFIGCRPTPGAILGNESFQACVFRLGGKLKVVDDDEFSITGTGEIDGAYLSSVEEDYAEMRGELVEILKGHGMSVKQYLEAGHGLTRGSR